MKQTKIALKTSSGRQTVPMTLVHTLVIGSGAAGLNAAVQLRRQGVADVLIVTEGLQMGTSINTGSDKQTYYKLGMCGAEADAPVLMAESYLAGGGMHGELALVEASQSPRAFMNLVNLGVPFPRDAYGQFVGYKTDHDPRQRATSVGPYTSREMCRALIREVKQQGIPVHEKRTVVELLVDKSGAGQRVMGAVALRADGSWEAYGAENVVFAVGGPGGLYQASVYPDVHTGAIGIGLQAGAMAQSLPESQYGMASTRFRWNVSGTYMQVIPRFISTAADGSSDAREFLRDGFDSVAEMHSMVFLKGYQWPFDARKAMGGSSLVDILVYIETVMKGRRVFLDYRQEPAGYKLSKLSEEARNYLERSKALQKTPLARLQHMNPGAIELYRDHGIDLASEMLEIAVCAQHNNGGLAGNHWWESLNIRHLFPVGEVNGSHGVYRPGGSALNSGQVGSLRAAEYIAHCYADWTVRPARVARAAAKSVVAWRKWFERCPAATRSWREERLELQARMSRAGAHIRSAGGLEQAVKDAWAQVRRLDRQGCRYGRAADQGQAAQNRQLCLAHAVYLEALGFVVRQGVGSRGSALVLHLEGVHMHDRLDASWKMVKENPAFREKVQETVYTGAGRVSNRWVPCRPVPRPELWFETVWAQFRAGSIYRG